MYLLKFILNIKHIYLLKYIYIYFESCELHLHKMKHGHFEEYKQKKKAYKYTALLVK